MNISVLQWNVWYKEDIDSIVEFLRNHPADIITLQEMPISHESFKIKGSPGYIAKQLGYNYFHKDMPIEDPDGKTRTLANGILSKFPIINSRFAWIKESKGAGGYDDEFRAYVEISLNIEGKEITVGTTHMSYTHKFEPTESKIAETDMLLKEINKHLQNYIFTGDLNATPESYTISALSKIMQNAGPSMNQKTWTTKPFSYNGFVASTLNWRLDYIFATKDIKVVSSEILKTKYSDHLPIRAQFEI